MAGERMKGLPIRPFVGHLLPAMLMASGVAASVSAAEPDVELWRLDCGSTMERSDMG